MSDKQLAKVLHWEQEKEDKAAREFKQAQGLHNQQQERMRGLQQYRLQYLQELQQIAASGIEAQRWSQQQAFIGQLDKACEQQSHAVAQAKMVADQRRDLWLKQQQKRKAVEMLLDKKRLHLAQLEAKREQQVLDEVSLQRFVRKQLAKRA